MYKAKLLEEDAQRQKSRVLWLEKRDLNTDFFHRMTRTRRGLNTIDRLQRNDGSWIQEEAQIIEEILDFYIKLYGTQSPESYRMEDLELKRADFQNCA